ncbi:murein L,D-transpeptidase family protein [Roseovarius carneus]|uniref:murein L,D-transpeptidase family protein n=1 Tax=Roseovarius carneus TaxID=2853164 RepID=UPI0026C17485
MGMRLVKLFAAALMVIGLASCGSKFKTYNGPEVTQIVVNKGARKMYLLHHDKVLKDYDIELGFTALGHKTQEGDGKTPEGTYFIDRRNPNSSFHLSLGISYPNEADVAQARARGVSPGGDIFIHGRPNDNPRGKQSPDWTAGCISVTNRQMETIYAMVKNGTQITINP